MDIPLDGALEGAQEGGFEVEIKGTLEVATEFHLKMHRIVYLLWGRSALNDSKKR